MSGSLFRWQNPSKSLRCLLPLRIREDKSLWFLRIIISSPQIADQAGRIGGARCLVTQSEPVPPVGSPGKTREIGPLITKLQSQFAMACFATGHQQLNSNS